MGTAGLKNTCHFGNVAEREVEGEVLQKLSLETSPKQPEAGTCLKFCLLDQRDSSEPRNRSKPRLQPVCATPR